MIQKQFLIFYEIYNNIVKIPYNYKYIEIVYTVQYTLQYHTF